MYLRVSHALILIFLLEISGLFSGKIEGNFDEKAWKKSVSAKERNTGKCALLFEVAIPRGPRSTRKYKISKTHKNLVRDHRRVRSCSECGLVVKGNKAFEEHAFSRHKGMKLVPCEKCDEKFLKYESMYNHRKIWHRRWDKCKYCRKICSFRELEEHEEMCAKTRNKNEIDGEWMSPTRCEPCGRKFQSYSSYRDHCRTSHRGGKFFSCHYCVKRFTSYNYLGVHLEKEHAFEMSKAGEKPPMKYPRGLPHSCPYCDTVVKGVKKYEQHGKIYHPGRAMFKCETCGERYRWKYAADRHAKESHGEDKTCCRYCSKCYSRVDRMRVHEEACGRKRALVEAKKVRAVNKKTNKDRMGRYYCDICHKTMYVLDETFKRHVTTHEYFDYCEVCDDRFERKRYPDGLEKHMKMRHPLRNNVDALLETARTFRVKFEKEEEIGKLEVLTAI